MFINVSMRTKEYRKQFIIEGYRFESIKMRLVIHCPPMLVRSMNLILRHPLSFIRSRKFLSVIPCLNNTIQHCFSDYDMAFYNLKIPVSMLPELRSHVRNKDRKCVVLFLVQLKINIKSFVFFDVVLCCISKEISENVFYYGICNNFCLLLKIIIGLFGY